MRRKPPAAPKYCVLTTYRVYRPQQHSTYTARTLQQATRRRKAGHRCDGAYVWLVAARTLAGDNPRGGRATRHRNWTEGGRCHARRYGLAGRQPQPHRERPGPHPPAASGPSASSPPVKLAARRRSTSARAAERSATTSRRAPGCCDEGALDFRDHVPRRLRFATPLSSALQDCTSSSLHVGKKAAVLQSAHSVRKHSHSLPCTNTITTS
jgi:hypothetical protein